MAGNAAPRDSSIAGESSLPFRGLPGLFASGAVAPGAVPGEVSKEVRLARLGRNGCVLRRFPAAIDSPQPFPYGHVIIRRGRLHKKETQVRSPPGCSAIITGRTNMQSGEAL